jgi:hypothetical protein
MEFYGYKIPQSVLWNGTGAAQPTAASLS